MATTLEKNLKRAKRVAIQATKHGSESVCVLTGLAGLGGKIKINHYTNMPGQTFDDFTKKTGLRIAASFPIQVPLDKPQLEAALTLPHKTIAAMEGKSRAIRKNTITGTLIAIMTPTGHLDHVVGIPNPMKLPKNTREKAIVEGSYRVIDSHSPDATYMTTASRLTNVLKKLHAEKRTINLLYIAKK